MAWRKRELSNLNAVLFLARNHHAEVMLRGAICILYAHWEGFIKNAAYSYLEFVGARRLKYRELTRNFWALSLKNLLGSGTQTRHTSFHLNSLNSIFEHGEKSFRKPAPDAIDTSSNLNSAVLTEILTTVGLDGANYLRHKALLDERLVRSRNSIAHGNHLSIEIDAYIELHDVIIGLMNRFKDDIQNAAAMASYRISQPVSTALHNVVKGTP